MSKVKNITPEERENALALIRKMGLEETEQQINYYVKMQRDSKKHREEKNGQTKKDSSGSIGKIFVWGIIIALFLMIKMCGGCNSCDSSDDSSSDSSAPSWIQGTWECDTPYGAIIIRIDGDRIYEDYGDGVMSGTYRIYDNAIHPNTGNPVTYELDMSSHRILDGRGGYFRKR